MKKLILSAICLATTLPGLAWAEIETKQFDAKQIKSADISNGSGKIRVVPAPTDKAEVVADKIEFDKGCQLIMELRGGALRVEVKNASKLFARTTQCQVNFDIKVPAKTTLELKNGSGDIAVEGILGSVKFSNGSGTVNISGDPEHLEGKNGSGNIFVTGTVTRAELKQGSGNTHLSYAKCPDKGSLNIVSGSGDVYVSLPEGSRISTSHKTGSGELVNELGESPNPQLAINVINGSGDVHISKNTK